MKNILAYLSFRGNCREVMTFYKECLGGELILMPFEGQPMEVKDEDKHKIMHSSLTINGNTILMASDGDICDEASQKEASDGKVCGHIALSVHCETEAEIKKYFKALAEGGKITMPLEETHWAALFGMLTDKYGVNWMFNYEKPQKEEPPKKKRKRVNT